MKLPVPETLRCLFFVIFFVSLFFSTGADQQTRSISRQGAQKIPFELFRNSLLFLQARVNNSEPMWFLLDTGATWSFLDSAKADALGIKTDGQRTITGGGGGAIDVSFAEGLSVDISGVKLSGQFFAITPWKNRYDRNVVGIIGAPFFKQFVIEIDYQASSLLVRKPNSYTYSGSGSIIALDFHEEIPDMSVGIKVGARDQVEARVAVDTGAGQTITLDPAFVEAKKMLESTEGMVKMSAGSLAGKVTYFKGRAKTIKLGRFTFEDFLIDFAPPGGMKDRAGADGVIGNGVLRRFKVILNYSRSQMILEPSELFSVPYDYEMTGLTIVAYGKEFRIGEIFKNSLADDAGLQAGDVIVAIDRHPASQMALTQLRQMFKQDGRERVLSIKRGTQNLQIKLQTMRIL
jgi:predicted aspartyl protease